MTLGRRGIRRAGTVCAAALPLLALLHAVAAGASEPIPVVPPGSSTSVDAGPGNQTDAHVSHDQVVYTDDASGVSRVHYKNVVTGADGLVPMSDDGQDALADISGTIVSYVHFTAARTSVWTFDIAAGLPPTEIDAQSSGYQFQAAVGGSTVAVQDFGLHGADLTRPGIVVYDRATRERVQLTPVDAPGYSLGAAVSATGDLVSWTTCAQPQVDCQVFDAVRSGGVWSSPRLLAATDIGIDRASDTNGSVVVYTSTRGGERDIYWQSSAGGSETHLAFTGSDSFPSISGDLLTFDHLDTAGPLPQADVYAYNLVTGVLYRVADGPASETLSDVSVDAGRTRVVWRTLEAGADNVYSRTFNTAVADTMAPAITIASPLNAGAYPLHQPATAGYTCDDGAGSGVATCQGTVPSGALIDTSTPGSHTFTVSTTDVAGNSAARTIGYTVSYRLCPLYDQAVSHRAGSTIPLKLQVCDANGRNMSAATLAVTAGRLTKRDSSASPVLANDSGNANPDAGFRYESPLVGYIYNLSTKALTTGTWVLTVTVASDPTSHMIQFDVR